MGILLRVALLIPSKYRRILKGSFPKLATAVVTKSSSLGRWQNKQAKLQKDYNRLAQLNGIKNRIGPNAFTKEIVVVTPTHPIKTGIATYSSKLIKELSSSLSVRVVSSFLQSNFDLAPGTRANLIPNEDKLVRAEILYMLGNGEHHWNTWKWILRYPGYVLIHDAKIPDIPLMEGEDPSWYNLDYSEKSLLFLGRLPLHTKGIFTHSHHAANNVKSQLSETQLRKIKVHVLVTGHPADKVISRGKTLADRPVIGTFGFQTANKNLHLTYTLISLIASKTNGTGVICGKIDRENIIKAKKLWRKYGNKLSDLRIYSWADEETYNLLMASVSVGVQLRNTSNGESSGPFTQLTSQGIPTIVTDIGAFSEFPTMPGVLKIPPVIDPADVESVCTPILHLLTNEKYFSSASQELVNFYSTKTYGNCAEEIFSKMFT